MLLHLPMLIRTSTYPFINFVFGITLAACSLGSDQDYDGDKDVIMEVSGCKTQTCELNLNRGRRESLPYTNYTYSLTTQDYNFGGTRTRYTVEEETVVQRDYETWDQHHQPARLQWSELGTDVGSHDNHFYGVWTIDDLYDYCADNVLTQDPDENNIVLTFRHGTIETCEYTPKDCFDGCATGIHVESLTIR